MTVCCESCHGPVSSNPGPPPCSSRCYSANRRGSCKRFRSTKGASKARRDHINSEIRSMRALLPIPLEDQERLSYLHSMSAICTFIRKSIFFQELHANGASGFLPYEDFLRALPGFIVVTTREGKLIYVSENVADYLGYSMVDILQGDRIYDMVDNADVEIMKSNLEANSLPAAERTFVCRMLMSKAFRLRHGTSCPVLVRGRFQAAPRASPFCQMSDSAFVALCTPTADRWRDANPHSSTEPFRTLHGPDMSFTYTCDSVLFHLGYSVSEMIGRSWYSFLHPEDLRSCASSHKTLLEAEESTLVEMVLRLQHRNLSWVWLYVRATKDSGKQEVSCMNYIISETEASFLKQRIYTDESSTLTQTQSPRSDVPRCHGDDITKVLKRERAACDVSEEPQPKISRISEPSACYLICTTQAEDSSQQVALTNSTVFPATPPYSPASSQSPAMQEDCPSDFLLDAYSYAETLLSPPESSPPYLSGHSALSGLPDHFPALDSLQTAVDATFGLRHFAVLQSPESCSSPSFEFPSCTAGSHLVPDCMQGLDAADGSPDCAFHADDLRLSTPPQEGVSPFLVLQEASDTSVNPSSLLTPNPSPTAECHFQYSERERAEISILARQISSLASSFDTYRGVGLTPANGKSTPPNEDLGPPCCWPETGSHPPRLEPILDESVIDSILRDLDSTEGHLPGHAGPSGLENSGQPLEASIPQVSVTLFTSLVEEPSLSQFPNMHPALDSCLVRSGCHEDASELHQLSQYLHSSLQQDELAEESMY